MYAIRSYYGSGIGVLKRNPDAKWRDTAERLPVLLALQAVV